MKFVGNYKYTIITLDKLSSYPSYTFITIKHKSHKETLNKFTTTVQHSQNT